MDLNVILKVQKLGKMADLFGIFPQNILDQQNVANKEWTKSQTSLWHQVLKYFLLTIFVTMLILKGAIDYFDIGSDFGFNVLYKSEIFLPLILHLKFLCTLYLVDSLLSKENKQQMEWSELFKKLTKLGGLAEYEFDNEKTVEFNESVKLIMRNFYCALFFRTVVGLAIVISYHIFDYHESSDNQLFMVFGVGLSCFIYTITGIIHIVVTLYVIILNTVSFRFSQGNKNLEKIMSSSLSQEEKNYQFKNEISFYGHITETIHSYEYPWQSYTFALFTGQTLIAGTSLYEIIFKILTIGGIGFRVLIILESIYVLGHLFHYGSKVHEEIGNIIPIALKVSRILDHEDVNIKMHMILKELFNDDFGFSVGKVMRISTENTFAFITELWAIWLLCMDYIITVRQVYTSNRPEN